MPAPSRQIAGRPAQFTARHVQLSRAALAAIAAAMITFSPDHSAAVGLSVFGGFATATGLVLVLAAAFVHPRGRRWPAVTAGLLSLALGTTAGIPALRSDELFFALVISWAALTGLVELLAGIRLKGTDGARDALTVGILGLVLAATLLLVPIGFSQQYTIEQGVTSSLTGIIVGVGLFGGYAAIIAVFLGIAGFTPGAKKNVETDAGADRLADLGGHA